MVRWDLAEKTGWTLDYIATLTPQDVYEYFSVKDANTKLDQSMASKRKVQMDLANSKRRGRRR